MDIVKGTIKDSVFTDLFGIPEYLFQLYQALHPDNKDVKESDLKDVTLRNVLTNDIYNDLGFKVKDRTCILMEAQSTWSPNIVIRIMLYLVESYKEYINERGYNMYGSAKMELPVPELYVLYTGARENRPEYLSLKEDFFAGKASPVDVRVKVLYGGKNGDIISQYVEFTKTVDEQVRLHGRSKTAIEETIRICKERGILRDYLEKREARVMSIMDTLFNQDVVFERYVNEEKKEAAKEATKENTRNIAVRMIELGLDNDQISQATGLPVEEVEKMREPQLV